MSIRLIGTIAVVVVAVIAILIYSTLILHIFMIPASRAGIVIWITPWGAANFTVPDWAIPGVVLAYQCNDPSLSMPWINQQLYVIKQYVKENRTIFINLFCEIYSPSYRWRGTLDYIDIPQFILKELNSTDPEGVGLYIGFSEEAACVANATCRAMMVKAYDEIREYLPKAKLFYYASGGEDANDVLSLARDAKLNLVGYDVWSYNYVNGTVEVPGWLMSKLEDIKNSGFNLLVGEVGFRYCDAKAYENPAAWNVQFTWNCTAPAVYLNQVLSQLTGLHPSYIGIWAWNDQTFGVLFNPEMVQVLQHYAEGG